MPTGPKRERPAVISLGEVRSNRAYAQLLAGLEDYCDVLLEREPWAVDQFFGSEPSEDELNLFRSILLDWLAFDYRAWDTGATTPERYAEAEDARLDDTARAMLTAWRASRMGIYEVTQVENGCPRLRDICTGAEHLVQLDPGIEPMQQGEVVICRVLPVGDTHHFGFDVRTIPTGPLPVLQEALENELLRMHRAHPDATYAELFKERWPVLHDAVTIALTAGVAAPLPDWETPSSLGCPPADANDLQREVAGQLHDFLAEDDVKVTDRLSAARMWWDAVRVLRPESGHAKSWAVGAAYVFLHDVLADGTTQTDMAEAFHVSPATIGSKARAIASALGILPLDDRYADPFDLRVRYRRPPEVPATLTVAASTAPAPALEPQSEQLLLSLSEDDVTMLALLGQSHAAAGRKKDARSYADRAKAAYLARSPRDRSGLLRLAELLAAVEDDAGILAVTAGESSANLDGPVVRRRAIAASRAGQSLDEVLAWLEVAKLKGEPLNLVAPLIGALHLMLHERIPVYKLDYQEQLNSLLGMEYRVNALTRSHLCCAIFYGKAKEGVQAVRAISAQRDPWVGKLLKHLYQQRDLPLTVQDAIERALYRR